MDFEELIKSLVGVTDLSISFGVAERCKWAGLPDRTRLCTLSLPSGPLDAEDSEVVLIPSKKSETAAECLVEFVPDIERGIGVDN